MSVETYVKNKQASGSNYDAALQKAAGLFVAHDMADIIRKTACRADGEYLYAELLCRSFRISRRDGKAEQLCSDGIKPAGYDTSMILYDLLAFPMKTQEPPAITFRCRTIPKYKTSILMPAKGRLKNTTAFSPDIAISLSVYAAIWAASPSGKAM